MISTHNQTAAMKWAQGIGQVAPRAAQDREAELARVARALEEALIEDDRPEIVTQFERAVVLFVKEKHWHSGLAAARQVFTVVSGWKGFDAAAYGLVVAQFAHNYAIELQQARLFEAAEEFLGEALQFFQTYGDFARQLVTAYQLGRVRQDQGKYVEAEQAYRASLEIAHRLSDPNHIAKNLFQLGQVAQLTDQAEKATDLYREVIVLAESHSRAPLSIAAAHQLGILAQTHGQHEAAQRWFEAALERAKETGDARAMADALHQLGMVAHEQGDYARAEELYHASLAQAFRLDHPGEAAPTLYQLAQAALARGDFAAAENYGRQSLDLLQAQGNVAAINRVKDLLRRLEFKRTAAASC